MFFVCAYYLISNYLLLLIWVLRCYLTTLSFRGYQWFHFFIKLKVHLYKRFLQLPKVSLTFSYSVLLAYKPILLLLKKKLQFNRYNEGSEGIWTLNISVGYIRIYQLSYKNHSYCIHICPKIILVLYDWSWLFWVIFGKVTRLNDSLEE